MNTLEDIYMKTASEAEFFIVARMFGFENEEIAIFLEITY